MRHEERRAAIAAYKERKREAGIYAVRCLPTGMCWVGKTPDIAAVRNRLWFSLGQRKDPRPALQAAWTGHGAEAMAFEVLERIEEKETETALLRERRLKERFAFWCDKLGAEAL